MNFSIRPNAWQVGLNCGSYRHKDLKVSRLLPFIDLNSHYILKLRLDNAQYIVISICIFNRAGVFRFLGFSNKGALCSLSFATNFTNFTKGASMFENIKKRDGRVVPFDSSKITSAIAKAGKATGEFSEREAKKLTLRVLTLAHQMRIGPNPEVEEIQDIVERVLLDSPYYKTAKAYILYREQHARYGRIPPKPRCDRGH